VLRVLLIVPDLHWEVGGDHAVRLALGLRARQCEVHVCTWRPEPADETTLSAAGVTLSSLNPRSARNPLLLCNELQRLRAFRPDIVHTFQPAGNRLGRLAAALFGRAPVFSTAHVSIDDSSPMLRWLRRIGHRAPGQWLVASEVLAKRWEAAGVPAARITPTVPGAVELATSVEETDRLRTLLSLPPGVPCIVCVGRLLRRKGFFDALWELDVIKQMGMHARLVIAGSGPERPRLAAFARAIEVEREVRILGREQSLGPLLGIADVVWFPSLGEDEPVLLLAAMAAGCPVVAAAVPGLAEFVQHGHTGLLVPPGEQILLVRETCRVLEDASLRSALVQHAREYARQHHDFDACAERHLQMYRHAIGGRTNET
jgi:glycosyltransferase involved in cell wall biosynthesis